MGKKPSYQQLEARVRELEARLKELEADRVNLVRSESRLKQAEHLALLGHWELDLVDNVLHWSEEIYRIFELIPGEFGATYEAFLERVHPADREFVDGSYSRSVQQREGYDIVHRLLLSDGTIKYVRERCRTEYDSQGRPRRSLGTVQDITSDMRSKHGFAGIIGREPAIQDVFDLIVQVAPADVPVLLQGESGTGKELVACAIHSEGPRARQPFVPVNCGALPEGLLETELFGHVRGAFTGATRDKKGRFELAHAGTLFLDEVGDLPLPLQVKLLRVVQEGRFERVGGERTLSVDVRIVSATNKDLREEVRQGRFRDDLYYRLAVVPINIPPLRERRSDIPLLVENLLEQEALQGRHTRGISDEAVGMLLDHPWPGNVRELQSAVFYAVLRSRGETITVEHLPVEVRQRSGSHPRSGASLKGQLGSPPSRAPAKRGQGRARKLQPREVERALAQAGGNKVKAAKILGVGRATLYRFLADQG